MNLVSVLEGELGGEVGLKESVLGDSGGELGVDISLELLAGLVESLGLIEEGGLEGGLDCEGDRFRKELHSAS